MNNNFATGGFPNENFILCQTDSIEELFSTRYKTIVIDNECIKSAINKMAKEIKYGQDSQIRFIRERNRKPKETTSQL